MRTVERLQKLKGWAEKNLCVGRIMKAPADDFDITQIITKEPKVYLAWAPMEINKAGGYVETIVAKTVPSIIIMPKASNAKVVEEKRFDRYSGVHRPKDLGNQLTVDILFSVYEPGTRMPGFIDSGNDKGEGLDVSLFLEGTEQGLFTLLNWMDDAVTILLRDLCIPGTDLLLNEETVIKSLYTDQAYVTDRRPIYYGFINCTFGGYSNEGQKATDELLI